MMRSFLVAVVALGWSWVASASEPIEVDAPIENVYIPSGFDDNDNVEIILQGTFPNSCYRVGRTRFTIEEATREIRVWATAYKYGGVCATLMTPFIQVVKVGMLMAGEYSIFYESDRSIVGATTVSLRKTDSADDYEYAPVEAANISVDPRSGQQNLTISGMYPLMLHGCAKIVEIRQVRDVSDIVVVQPIMGLFDGDACEGHDINFKITTPVEQPIYGPGLLHVRVIHGNSYNRYVDIPQ